MVKCGKDNIYHAHYSIRISLFEAGNEGILFNKQGKGDQNLVNEAVKQETGEEGPQGET